MPKSGARNGYRLAVIASVLGASLALGAARMPTDESPVADAVMRGDSSRVRQLIKQGLDVNAAQPDGMTALHWAAQRGDAGGAQMLMYAGARVDAVTRNGNYTPLHLAARHGRSAAVRALLAAGADVNSVTTTGAVSALHFAASNGDPATVAALLDKGAPVDIREGAWGQTPLMWAASANRLAALDMLIKRGANLELASKIEDISAKEKAERAMLVQRGRRVAAMKAADAAPTVAAAGPGASGAPATPRVAVAVAAPAPVADAKAPDTKAPDTKDSAKKSPAAAAPVKRDSATTPPPQTGFNNRGPTYGDLIGNKGGLTALLFAVRDGSDECVARLLEAGAKINHVSEGDHTSPLLMATINGRFDMAKMLLEKGADVKLQSDAGATPLYATINVQWAAKSLYPQPTAQLQQTTSYLDLMESFLKAGADVNVRLKKHLWFMSYNFDLLGVNTVGATAFWRAAYGTDVPAMKLLVKYGADITIPTIKPTGRLPGDDSGGDDAAAGGKDPSGLAPIPDGGPGVYPIHAATGVGYGEGFAANSHRHAPDAWMASAKYLIEELKVDVNMRDHNGYNVVHHAAARGDNALITYLASKGGDIMAISRRGQTTVDMANGPVQRIPPFLETVELLVKMGAKNSNKCKSC
ncbi:ankyrin repeat domain-containing protein [Gemmatimonas sp.]|uniref:ankyrin repeat domain-containing protein n=1 Tax=Gemmatimonas sp. TaxID=1962908 RepID=UPI00286DB37F|nr:ankyrin repeat domain-containing protein [Gemmatimonas sp.]